MRIVFCGADYAALRSLADSACSDGDAVSFFEFRADGGSEELLRAVAFGPLSADVSVFDAAASRWCAEVLLPLSGGRLGRVFLCPAPLSGVDGGPLGMPLPPSLRGIFRDLGRRPISIGEISARLGVGEGSAYAYVSRLRRECRRRGLDLVRAGRGTYRLAPLGQDGQAGEAGGIIHQKIKAILQGKNHD